MIAANPLISTGDVTSDRLLSYDKTEFICRIRHTATRIIRQSAGLLVSECRCKQSCHCGGSGSDDISEPSYLEEEGLESDLKAAIIAAERFLATLLELGNAPQCMRSYDPHVFRTSIECSLLVFLVGTIGIDYGVCKCDEVCICTLTEDLPIVPRVGIISSRPPDAVENTANVETVALSDASSGIHVEQQVGVTISTISAASASHDDYHTQSPLKAAMEAPIFVPAGRSIVLDKPDPADTQRPSRKPTANLRR